MAVARKKRCDVLSISLYILLNCFLVIGIDDYCMPLRSCSCKFKNGSIIDLSSVAPANGDKWSAKAKNDKDHSVYFFNPCNEFSMDGGCSHVTVCQKQGTSYYALGKSNRMFTYNYTINRLEIQYQISERITNVTLICTDGPTKFEAYGETNPGSSMTYLMTLYSKCACPDGCLQSSADGLSTGSVLIILLVTFSCIYFLGGMAYLKIVRGASGFEMIPNYEFWLDFPLLVRDGVIFVLSGCRAETTYERI
ncbi:cation-dependent mannose-6-phosphate receptor-like [Centruroides vittatus]|uniref:cation-dependent mannose-6-phosphate receptor-like n=1 Tax=Centruroides vittatus TaxID=120091 RepID=UPI00350EA7A3